MLKRAKKLEGGFKSAAVDYLLSLKFFQRVARFLLENRTQNLEFRPFLGKAFNANTEPIFGLLPNLDYKPEHIVDVSAHRGAWTISAMRLFPDAKFTLFETQCGLLSGNKALQANNVTLNFLGVGPKSSEAFFIEHARQDSRFFTWSENEAETSNSAQQLLTINSLDDYFQKHQDWPRPQVLNIEGKRRDLEVLKVGAQMIKSCDIGFVLATVLNRKSPDTAPR
jgi:FkbM family methyltransferase